jgi:hypothetical protein
MLVPRGNGLSGTMMSCASAPSRSSGTWLSFFSKEETERVRAIWRPWIQKAETFQARSYSRWNFRFVLKNTKFCFKLCFEFPGVMHDDISNGRSQIKYHQID